jgi:hypothetical protein
MNRALAAELIGCLHVAGPVEAHLRRLGNFRPRDWEASLDWLNLSGIALAFWDRLQTLGAEDAVPPQVGARLAANLAQQRQRVAAMTQEFDSLNCQFERAGIEYAAWKGFALIPEYCPDACLRPMYDYDYLISEDAWAGASRVLQAAGYVRKPDHGTPNEVTFAPPNLPPRLLRLPGGLCAAAFPRKVELHRSAWDEEAFRIPLRVPERPLDRKVRRTWQGLSFYSLGEEDAFVFQTLHAFQHILHNWCRLGWLWEIAYFLQHRSRDDSFWRNLSAHREASDPLTEVVAVVISLAAGLFHAALPAPINDQIPGAMRGPVALWVDHYGLPSALDNFSENKSALFLYREFVRDEAAWRQIRRSRLLPMHRPNRVAGTIAPATAAMLPARWKQGWYVAQRLLHHSVSGVGHVWESARWKRLRRLSAHRVLPSGVK